MTRALFLLYWSGALVVALATLRIAVLPLDVVMQHMAHYRTLAPVGLWTHLVFGSIALALAPFQTWAGLRARRPAVHRLLGRVYVASVAIGAVGSLLLLPAFAGSAFAATGFAVLAVLWLASTAMGLAHARARRFDLHRRWMLRSVALTLTAVTLRLIMAPLLATGWSVVETYEITAWLSWLVNLTVVETMLRRSGRPASAKGDRGAAGPELGGR